MADTVKRLDSPRVALLALASAWVHSTLAPWCLKAGLAAHARAAHTAAVIEGTVNETPEAVLARVLEQRPDVLGVSCHIWNIAFVEALLPLVRRALPGCVVVLGGPEVSPRPGDALAALPEADFVIVGEGEVAFAMLVDALCGMGSIGDVPGLVHRGMDSPRVPPAGGGLAVSPYTPEYAARLGGRIAYVETSRGCPFACAFCLSGGEGTRFLPLEEAYARILAAAAMGAHTLKFVDRTFNANPARAKEILRFILSRLGKDIPPHTVFHFEIAADLLDEEAIHIVRESPAGLFRFEAGLQSLDEGVLRAAQRRTDTAKALRNLEALIGTGKAHVHADLIAGLPGEGLEDFARGFDRAYLLRPHALQLGFLKLLHGSAMRNDPARFPCEFDPRPPYEVRRTPAMGEGDFAELKRTALALDKLHNSGRFPRTLVFLTGEAGVRPYDLFAGIAKEMVAHPRGAAMPLDALTGLLLDHSVAFVPGEAARLRDLMLLDRLCGVRTSVVPECIKRPDARMHAVKRAMDRRFPRGEGIARSYGILCAGEERAVCVDYDAPDPVTGQYAANIVPLRELAGLHP
ncbi:MAG TPA: DUF4080 domain-containing protein [Candidatus Limnocylindria bacterium]|nr:DUF4080 domain-containing protein [Candidatus Limnocylindria bacterium]